MLTEFLNCTQSYNKKAIEVSISFVAIFTELVNHNNNKQILKK